MDHIYIYIYIYIKPETNSFSAQDVPKESTKSYTIYQSDEQ
jgi:hypothetical protein